MSSIPPPKPGAVSSAFTSHHGYLTMSSTSTHTPLAITSGHPRFATSSHRHLGPAGIAYASITQAGNAQLLTSANHFLNGNGSVKLPAVFVNKHTQYRDPAGNLQPAPGVSTTSGRFPGVQGQSSGEAAEMKFYHALDKYLSEEKSSETTLLINGLQVNSQKLDVLANDLPAAATLLNALKSKGEHHNTLV